MSKVAETFALALQSHQAGKLAEAAALYRQALDFDPSHAQAHNNLGNVFVQLGRRSEAIGHYHDALRLRPNYVQAHSNLGYALRLEGRLADAERHCRQAVSLRPDFAEAHVNLGIALTDQGKLDAAIASFKCAFQLNPQLPEAYCNLGNVFERQEKLDEAVRCYQQALRLRQDFPDARNNLGCALLRQGQAEEALECFRETLRISPGFAAAHSNLVCCSNYDPAADPDEVFAAHRKWGRMLEEASPAPLRSRLVKNGSKRPLRVGYVSPDLRQHALMRYLGPVLAHHDPASIEVFCYAEVSCPDDVTKRLQALAHQWRSTCHLADAEVAKLISVDGIDILVDLAGHTANNRLGVFARKPAPIQVTWLGYMNTTGLSTIDYRLTDEVLDPPAQTAVRDTEELFRLPGGMCCFAPPQDAPPVSPLPALKRGHLTFGSLANLFKLNNVVFDLWSRVLHAVPTARLLMFRGTLTQTAQDHVRHQFAERGIASERLDLRRGSCDPAYLGIYDEIDVTLDTFPCTGGVTTCESLWMGVPVLSLCGIRPASRNSASILSRVGLGNWTAETPDGYVALAAGLASDLNELAQLRVSMRDRMSHSLCDALRFTRMLEEAYHTMWQRFCERKRRS